jgi:small subunit ribosomal protein S19
VNYNLLYNSVGKTNIIKTKSRSSTILQSFIGKTIYVYSGRLFKKVIITEDMVGRKLGEFSFTRKLGKIHSKKIRKQRRK